MTCGWGSFRGNVANLMLDLQVALAEGSGQFKSVSSRLCNDGLSTVLTSGHRGLGYLPAQGART
jgi:hypothetical protein